MPGASGEGMENMQLSSGALLAAAREQTVSRSTASLYILLEVTSFGLGVWSQHQALVRIVNVKYHELLTCILQNADYGMGECLILLGFMCIVNSVTQC